MTYFLFYYTLFIYVGDIMEELEKNLEEIKENIEKLRKITDVLVKQKSLLDKLKKFDKIKKEVV